jgi:hypothetical protein
MMRGVAVMLMIVQVLCSVWRGHVVDLCARDTHATHHHEIADHGHHDHRHDGSAPPSTTHDEPATHVHVPSDQASARACATVAVQSMLLALCTCMPCEPVRIEGTTPRGKPSLDRIPEPPQRLHALSVIKLQV